MNPAMSQGPSPAENGDAPGGAAPARLEMRHISKNFGGVHALRDVSLICPQPARSTRSAARTERARAR